VNTLEDLQDKLIKAQDIRIVCLEEQIQLLRQIIELIRPTNNVFTPPPGQRWSFYANNTPGYAASVSSNQHGFYIDQAMIDRFKDGFHRTPDRDFASVEEYDNAVRVGLENAVNNKPPV
jgi:hypothetical protein